MMITKLAPSPRDMVSSPRSTSHRSPTGGGGGNGGVDGALSPRSEGATRRQRGGGGLSPEISTRLLQDKIKAAALLSVSPTTRSGPPSNTATTTTKKEVVAGVDTAVTHNAMVESPTAASATIEQAPTILTEAPPPARRSKRILVVDPKSGRKYDLQEDDHSLTDKELHVYHRSHTTVTAAAESPAAMSKATRGTKSVPTSPVNNNNNNGIGGNRNISNVGSLFVKKNTKNAATPPSKTNDSTVPQSTLINDDDVRTYNSAALQLLMNDDAHTLETASALTEVSYYNTNNNHRDFYYGKGGEILCGDGGMLQSSSPFDCMLPTSCKSAGEFALGGEGAKTKKEGRDDVESVEKGRYKHVSEELEQEEKMMVKNTGRASQYDDYQQQQHAQSKYNNKDFSQLSPIAAAFSTIMDSPRMLFSGFFGNTYSPEKNSTQRNRNQTAINDDYNENDLEIMHPLTSPTTTSPRSNGGGAVVHHTPLSFRRVVCMVVFPQEVQSTVEGQTVGLLGMKFVQSGHDFQTHVRWVARGSKAERMGVRRGDIVSFAVALSNMTEEQNCFLAEKLIKRLESVGMRTSYRELYDIFLSKTTNARPIGMVFRRWKNRGGGSGSSPPNNRATMIGSSYPSNTICITNEFEWSSDFLQCLSIKCREYEFDLKVPSLKRSSPTNAEDIMMRGSGSAVNKLRSFLPLPNVETTLSNNGSFSDFVSYVMDNLSLGYDGVQSSPLMKCMDSSLGIITTTANSTSNGSTRQERVEFLSNRILCSLVEQSMGLIFLRRLSTSKSNKDRGAVGSGFALMRKTDGSWSAPCFLSILGSKDDFTECDADDTSSSSLIDDVKMIIIHKKDLVNALIGGNAVKFSVRKDERAHVLVRDATVIGVQEGRFQLATDFFLAVKVNDAQNQGAYSLSSEYQSSDQITAFDILTGNVSPPDQSVDFYGALQSLELPYSMHSHPVVPEILQRYSDSDWVEFLPDNGSFASSCGMRTKLEMIAQRNASPDDMLELDIFARKFKYYLMDGVPVHRVNPTRGSAEEKVLRLTIKDPNCVFTSSLELTRRLLPGVSNVGVPSNFSTTLESITKMSRTPPTSMSGMDEDERKRFFSIETDLSPGPIMMLAKCKKDLMILLCGLKLLLEMERMAQG